MACQHAMSSRRSLVRVECAETPPQLTEDADQDRFSRATPSEQVPTVSDDHGSERREGSSCGGAVEPQRIADADQVEALLELRVGHGQCIAGSLGLVLQFCLHRRLEALEVFDQARGGGPILVVVPLECTAARQSVGCAVKVRAGWSRATSTGNRRRPSRCQYGCCSRPGAAADQRRTLGPLHPASRPAPAAAASRRRSAPTRAPSRRVQA